MLPSPPHKLQRELKRYYHQKSPKALAKAIKTKGGFHHPAHKPLRKIYRDALRQTTLYKTLENTLQEHGYRLEGKISFEKFDIFHIDDNFFFHADTWLHAIPYKALTIAIMDKFPASSMQETKRLVDYGLWSSCYNAIVVYPDKQSLYAFVKNKSDKYIASNLSFIEKRNINRIGGNRTYEKTETKVIRWESCDNDYLAVIETKAWSGGQRYRITDTILIDKDGKVHTR